MLKHPCVLHHLQLDDIILNYGLKMVCIMVSHLFLCDVVHDTHNLHKLRVCFSKHKSFTCICFGRRDHLVGA